MNGMIGIVARYRRACAAPCPCGGDLVLDWYWRTFRAPAHCVCGRFLGWARRAGEYELALQVERVRRAA